MRQRVGFTRHNRCLYCDLLRVRPLLANVTYTEDRITNREIADSLTERGDDAREVAAWHVREVRDRCIASGAHFPVGGVHARNMNIHQQFARADRGVGYVTVLQDLRTAVLHEESGFHRYPICEKNVASANSSANARLCVRKLPDCFRCLVPSSKEKACKGQTSFV